MQTLAFEMQIGIKPVDAERVVPHAEDLVGAWFSSVACRDGAVRATWVGQAASGRTVGATTAARVADGLAECLGYKPTVLCRAVPTADDVD